MLRSLRRHTEQRENTKRQKTRFPKEEIYNADIKQNKDHIQIMFKIHFQSSFEIMTINAAMLLRPKTIKNSQGTSPKT